MASEGTERRLAAILSADVVGYSRLMAEDEAGTIRTLGAYRDEIGGLVRHHRGRVVDATGDNLLAEFPTALDAAECAVEIQRVLAARNAGLPEPRRMQFRVGVHMGDIAAEGERIYGDGVNIAARLEALAEPGGICVSDLVQSQVRGKLDIDYEDLGERELRNITEPVHVYRVRAERASTPAPPRATLEEAPRGTRSLAVLPLDNLGSPEQEYVADGVTDALIESLAQVGSELLVISRTSVKQYKGTTKPARQIADELGVEFLIEGTAQRQDDRVLIRVQLIEAREDTHRWAQSYERDLRDFFTMQREIARTVAGEIEIALKPEREPLLAATRPVDPEALDLYLRAVSLRGPPTLAASWGPPAIELLERSVALDPDFTEGWVALAEARGLLGTFGLGAGSRDDLVRAREAAQRALELDERLGAAHAALGAFRLYYDWDFPGARSAFERGLELSPSDPRALSGLAGYLLWVGLGKSPEAELLLERLLRVAPLDLYFRASRIRHFMFTREYERGIAEAERIRALDPEFVDAYIGMHYFLLGRPEDAVRELLAWAARAGLAPEAAGLAPEAFQRGSEEGGWQGGMRALRSRSIEAATRGAFGFAYGVAIQLAMSGETDEAMTWLERAYEERDPLLLAAKTDPRMDPLRSDPRFQDLLRRIGFPEE